MSLGHDPRCALNGRVATPPARYYILCLYKPRRKTTHKSLVRRQCWALLLNLECTTGCRSFPLPVGQPMSKRHFKFKPQVAPQASGPSTNALFRRAKNDPVRSTTAKRQLRNPNLHRHDSSPVQPIHSNYLLGVEPNWNRAVGLFQRESWYSALQDRRVAKGELRNA